MNKGKWTKDEHKAFLLGWKQYGNDWKYIVTIVNTRTAMQIKKTLKLTSKNYQRERTTRVP
jgi:hypothetical protein